jgi:hypothetical protein
MSTHLLEFPSQKTAKPNAQKSGSFAERSCPKRRLVPGSAYRLWRRLQTSKQRSVTVPRPLPGVLPPGIGGTDPPTVGRTPPRYDPPFGRKSGFCKYKFLSLNGRADGAIKDVHAAYSAALLKIFEPFGTVFNQGTHFRRRSRRLNAPLPRSDAPFSD